MPEPSENPFYQLWKYFTVHLWVHEKKISCKWNTDVICMKYDYNEKTFAAYKARVWDTDNTRGNLRFARLLNWLDVCC